MGMLVVLIFPFNTLFVYSTFVLYKNRRDINTTLRIHARFKIFFQKWRPENWYWGFVFVMQQQLLALTLTLFPSAPFSRLVWVLSVLFVYVIMLVFVLPWRVWEISLFEIVTTMVVFMMLLVCGAFVNPPQQSPFENLSIGLFIVATAMVVMYCFRMLAAVFLSLPKPMQTEAMDKCILSLCKVVPALPDETRVTLLGMLSARERDVFVSFIRIMQNVGLNSFDFGVDFGMRHYIPHADFVDERARQTFKMRLESHAKTLNGESYI